LRLGKKAVDFAELKEILTAIRSACFVRALDIEVHDLGLEIAERYRLSICDSLIVAAALRAKCSVLYSEDLRHAQTIEQLSIRNPFSQ
jgi:predicted nucleic acid-binding protein